MAPASFQTDPVQNNPALPAGDDLLIDSILGGGLPPEAERHLRAAGLNYHLDDVAETHLQQALDIAPNHAATLIGLYRYYFYKGRLHDALDVAYLCLEKALRDNRLPSDWRQVRRHQADFSNFGSVLPRFFLFTLKGFAYLNMRLGNLDFGYDAVKKLLELDPTDKIGAGVLMDVLARMGQDEDET